MLEKKNIVPIILHRPLSKALFSYSYMQYYLILTIYLRILMYVQQSTNGEGYCTHERYLL